MATPFEILEANPSLMKEENDRLSEYTDNDLIALNRISAIPQLENDIRAAKRLQGDSDDVLTDLAENNTATLSLALTYKQLAGWYRKIFDGNDDSMSYDEYLYYVRQYEDIIEASKEWEITVTPINQNPNGWVMKVS
jgi:hypothetical protein